VLRAVRAFRSADAAPKWPGTRPTAARRVTRERGVPDHRHGAAAWPRPIFRRWPHATPTPPVRPPPPSVPCRLRCRGIVPKITSRPQFVGCTHPAGRPNRRNPFRRPP
jgi:hypothetical protein